MMVGMFSLLKTDCMKKCPCSGQQEITEASEDGDKWYILEHKEADPTSKLQLVVWNREERHMMKTEG